jgi:hypothetical protein
LLFVFIVPYVIYEGAMLSVSPFTVLSPIAVEPLTEDITPFIETPDLAFAAAIC